MKIFILFFLCFFSLTISFSQNKQSEKLSDEAISSTVQKMDSLFDLNIKQKDRLTKKLQKTELKYGFKINMKDIDKTLSKILTKEQYLIWRDPNGEIKSEALFFD